MTPDQLPKVPRDPSAIAEVEHLRHSEMQSLSDRLGRVSKFPWSSAWVATATLLGGAIVGGGIALIPFLSANPAPSSEDKLIYFGSLAVLVLLVVVCVVGAATSHFERAESINAIKKDFDTHILGTFDAQAKH